MLISKAWPGSVWMVLIAALLVGGTAAGAPLPEVLQDGSTVAGLSGRAGSAAYFRIFVPPGATSLEVATSGGVGDCDLYVAPQARPTPRRYHARSVGPTNDDSIRLRRPSSDWWHILVYGAGDYRGVQLRARLHAPGGPVDPAVIPLTNNVVQYGISAREGQRVHFRITVPAGANELAVTTAGGSGDCDLYLSRGVLPTRQAHSHHSTGPAAAERIAVARPAADTWYILLYAYAAFRDVKILASFGQAPPPQPQARIVITAPTAATGWRVGGQHTIRWQASRNVRYVRIEFSADDGRTWMRSNFPVRLNASDGQYVWRIPFDFQTYTTRTGRIRLTGTTQRGRAVVTVSDRFHVAPIWVPFPHTPPQPPRPPRRLARDRYEDDNKPERAKRITVGETQARTVYPEEDVDWLLCASPRGGRYVIRLTGVTETIDVEVWVPRQDGTNKLRGLTGKEMDSDDSLTATIPPGIPHFYLKIDCDDEDDEGSYRVTILRQ